MTLVVIGPTYPYKGGISHYNTLLCENLNKKHNTICISFKRQYPKLLFPGKEQRDYDSKAQIKVKSVELIDSINPISWFKTFFYIKKRNPRLVIFYWWTPFWTPTFATIAFLIKKFSKCKILFLCHNVLPHEESFFDKILTKMVLKYGDFFITHSEKDKSNLLKIIPRALVKINPHPTYDIFSKEQKKKELNLKLRKNTILFFGFVRKYKGLMNIIKVLPIILKKIDLDLLIVGEFWKDKEDYLREIRRLGLEDNIKIIDRYVPNEEVGNYFDLANVVVLPYLSATNSGIVQTAFGFNKPVIVTDVGGLPEVVSNGKTGFVVQRNNNVELANAIIKFYKEKKEKEFIKNIKKEKSRFSWDKMVKLIEEFKW